MTSFIQFLSNGISKTKLAMLALLYCGEFVKKFLQVTSLSMEVFKWCN